MIKEKVLIFGSTGQIGRHLIRKLTKNNYKVTCQTRNSHKAIFLKTSGSIGYIEIVEAKMEKIISTIGGKLAYRDTQSNLTSIGHNVLTPDIFDILGKLGKGSGNEIQLVDAINFQAQRDVVNTLILEGTRFDCGSIDGFISAINHEYKKKGNKSTVGFN